MKFRNVSHAVGFAEEILNRPVVKSAHSVLDNVGGQGQDINEIRDVAHTISAMLANLGDATASQVYRFIHGKGSLHQLSLATMGLSRNVIAEGLTVAGRTHVLPDHEVRSVVLATLKLEREVERGAKRTFAKIGRMVGLNDGRKFRMKYRDVVLKVRVEMERLVSVVEREMTPTLAELDLFD